MNRVRARIDGTVQGVGFRPYVFRLAEELGLDGFVANDERGVVLEVEGDPDAVERFLERLPREAPALAAVERVGAEPITPLGEAGFRIVESAHGGVPAALVSPDTATCAACLAELFDPADRRHRYPFINCTDCGPQSGHAFGWAWKRRSRGSSYSARHAAHIAKPAIVVSGRS